MMENSKDQSSSKAQLFKLGLRYAVYPENFGNGKLCF